MVMRLSPHFWQKEFEKDGPMPVDSVPICKVMCLTILEPIRDHFAAPYIVTSGNRPPAVNVAVGGVPTSEHIYTARQCASDGYFVKFQHDMRPVFDWVRENPKLDFDQVILEHGHSGDVLHVGLKATHNRRQALEGKQFGISKVYNPWPVVPLLEMTST